MKIQIIILILFFMFYKINNIYSQNWTTALNAAKTIATKENKPIIMVFQGSDWCAPCIKLDKEIWSTEVFKKYASQHYVMLKVDFPRKKKNKLPKEQAKANAELAEKYNKNGYFPYVVVLSPNGKVLGVNSYKKTTPQTYIAELNAFVSY